MVKPCQNKKGPKFVSAAPKMVSFLQLAAEKKTPFFLQLKQIFGPSYFDRALPFFNQGSLKKFKTGQLKCKCKYAEPCCYKYVTAGLNVSKYAPY